MFPCVCNCEMDPTTTFQLTLAKTSRKKKRKKKNNNNHLSRFLLTRAFYRWAPHPPLCGGSSSSQESPVLPIPSYPALCRKDTTSWNYGRSRTHNGLKNHRLPAKHQLLGFLCVLPCKQIMHTRAPQRKPFSLWKPEMVWARNRQLGKIKGARLGFQNVLFSLRDNDSFVNTCKNKGAPVKTRFSKCVVFLRI